MLLHLKHGDFLLPRPVLWLHFRK